VYGKKARACGTYVVRSSNARIPKVVGFKSILKKKKKKKILKKALQIKL